MRPLNAFLPLLGARALSGGLVRCGAWVEALHRGFLVDRHDHCMLGQVHVKPADKWAIPVKEQGSGRRPSSSGGYLLKAN